MGAEGSKSPVKKTSSWLEEAQNAEVKSRIIQLAKQTEPVELGIIKVSLYYFIWNN